MIFRNGPVFPRTTWILRRYLGGGWEKERCLLHLFQDALVESHPSNNCKCLCILGWWWWWWWWWCYFFIWNGEPNWATQKKDGDGAWREGFWHVHRLFFTVSHFCSGSRRSAFSKKTPCEINLFFSWRCFTIPAFQSGSIEATYFFGGRDGLVPSNQLFTVSSPVQVILSSYLKFRSK